MKLDISGILSYTRQKTAVIGKKIFLHYNANNYNMYACLLISSGLISRKNTFDIFVSPREVFQSK